MCELCTVIAVRDESAPSSECVASRKRQRAERRADGRDAEGVRAGATADAVRADVRDGRRHMARPTPRDTPPWHAPCGACSCQHDISLYQLE